MIRNVWKNEVANIRTMGFKGLTLDQMGRFYGITSERMRQVINQYNIFNADEYYGFRKRSRDAKLYGPTATDIQKRKFLHKRNNCLGAKKKIEWNLTFKDIIWPTHCPILGIELDYTIHKYSRADNLPVFDRLVPSKGYVIGNVSIISNRANRIKNDGTADEHVKIARWMEKLIAK